VLEEVVPVWAEAAPAVSRAAATSRKDLLCIIVGEVWVGKWVNEKLLSPEEQVKCIVKYFILII
jgi:hypothetical protein